MYWVSSPQSHTIKQGPERFHIAKLYRTIFWRIACKWKTYILINMSNILFRSHKRRTIISSQLLLGTISYTQRGTLLMKLQNKWSTKCQWINTLFDVCYLSFKGSLLYQSRLFWNNKHTQFHDSSNCDNHHEIHNWLLINHHYVSQWAYVS